MYRLWQLFFGAQAISDPNIREFMECENSLMYFRWMKGIQVKTLKDCHRLITWAENHGVSMADINACGKLFDLVNCKVKKPPSKPKRILSFIFGAFLFCAAIISMEAFLPNHALAQFKSTGRYFWLTTQAARPVRPLDAPILTANSCNAPLSDKQNIQGNFTFEERQILCSGFSNVDGISKFISKAIESQRWLLMALMVGILWLLAHVVIFLRNAWAAETLFRRLEKC